MTAYRFDDFELDPAAYRLSRREERIALEPKILEVLAFLIEHRDRVLSKQELLDAVWPDQYVTESVLTQSIYEIRRALGETSREGGHVRTVHGRGYQFCGEVEIVETQHPTESTPATPEPAHTQSGSRNRRVRLLMVAAVTVLASALWVIARNDENLVPPAAPSAVTPVALVPIATTVTDPGLSMAALSITDQIAHRLQRIPGLTLRAVDYAGTSVTEFDSLAEYAIHNGARFVLVGTLNPSEAPDRGELTVGIVEVESLNRAVSTPLGEFEVPIVGEGNLAEFVAVRESILDRLLDRFEGASTDAPDASPLPDAEAYRLYLRAIQSMLDNSCDGGRATGLLAQALEIDGGSALIWSQHASSLYRQVFACGADASTYQEALRSLERAIEIDPGEVGAHMTRAAILIETGKVEEAYRNLLTLRERLPRRPEILFEMDYALRYAGYLERSIELTRAGLRLDPQFYVVFERGGVPNNLLYAGRLREYLEIVPATGTAYHRFHRGLALYRSEDNEAALAALEPAFRESPGDLFGRFSWALASTIRGEAQPALVTVRQIRQQRQDLSATDGEITYRQAQLLALAGAPEEALDEFERAVEQGFFCTPYFRSDPLVDSVRDHPRFLAALDRAQQRHKAFGKAFGLQPPENLLNDS